MKKEHIIEFDLKKYVGCGLCRKDCPAGNVLVKNKKAEIITRLHQVRSLCCGLSEICSFHNRI